MRLTNRGVHYPPAVPLIGSPRAPIHFEHDDLHQSREKIPDPVKFEAMICRFLKIRHSLADCERAEGADPNLFRIFG